MQRKRARAVKKATSRGRKKYDDRGGGRALEIVHLWVGGCKEMAQAEGLGNSTRESDHAGACLAVEMVHLWVGGCKGMAQTEGLGNSIRESGHAGACLSRSREATPYERGKGKGRKRSRGNKSAELVR